MNSICLRRGRAGIYLCRPLCSTLANTNRVLFVDDYTNSGDTCHAIKTFLVEERGFDPENIRTLTLITTVATQASGKAPDFNAHETPAARADLFYMFRR